jgi:small subunit ribosomal protein S1
MASEETLPNDSPSAAPGPPDLNSQADSVGTDQSSVLSDADELALEDFEKLLDDDLNQINGIVDGDVLTGTVVSIREKYVLLDVGRKSEGAVPIEQLTDASGNVTVQRGDQVEVMIDGSGITEEGHLRLSRQKAALVQQWGNLEQAFQEKLILSGHVLARVKGGLSVNVGVPAFMPGSQLDVRPVHNLDTFIGQDIPVRIVKLNKKRGNVVVSRRMAIEEDISVRKTNVLESIQEGDVITGFVKNLTDYGAFIDLGGIDGLLHVSDMSYGRIQHPNQMLHLGDEITLRVLKFDRDKERISLGLKQLHPDPWESAVERYPRGTRVVGRVMSLTDYGAFVELEAGVEGLIHISEMTWSRRMKHPSKIAHIGDQVEAVVLEVKPPDRRISLGIKQLEDDPWTTVAERYAVGSVVEGRVRKLTEFGAFLEIEEGVDGLVHVSDLSWTKRVKTPAEVLKKGQIVQAVILALDSHKRRLSLGIKQLQPDAWEQYFRVHQIGDVVEGKVSRAAAFGVFVELAEGIEGLCHNSEIVGGSSVAREVPLLALGETHQFKIIKMNEIEKKIGLSQKQAVEELEKQRLAEYQRQGESARQTLTEAQPPETSEQ